MNLSFFLFMNRLGDDVFLYNFIDAPYVTRLVDAPDAGHPHVVGVDCGADRDAVNKKC